VAPIVQADGAHDVDNKFGNGAHGLAEAIEKRIISDSTLAESPAFLP
jgi:hypothetical protein